MKTLQIIEILKTTEDPATHLVHEQIKITNISTDYINNLKLIIDDKDHALVEQLVTRERGSLSFSPTTTCLELGNLAPNESAYFEYKYTPPSNLAPLSFTEHISLTYNDSHQDCMSNKKIVEFLENPTQNNTDPLDDAPN